MEARKHRDILFASFLFSLSYERSETRPASSCSPVVVKQITCLLGQPSPLPLDTQQKVFFLHLSTPFMQSCAKTPVPLSRPVSHHRDATPVPLSRLIARGDSPGDRAGNLSHRSGPITQPVPVIGPIKQAWHRRVRPPWTHHGLIPAIQSFFQFAPGAIDYTSNSIFFQLLY